MDRCRPSGRSPGGHEARAAMRRTGRPRRGRYRRRRAPTRPGAAKPWRWHLDLPLYLNSMQRDVAQEAVFKPVRPPTTFEETVERLGTAIRLGLLPAGSRLPPERDLADELGISRSTLRQALTTLVQSGHLVSLRAAPGDVRRRTPAAGGGGLQAARGKGLGRPRLPGRDRDRRHDPGGRTRRAGAPRATRRPVEKMASRASSRSTGAPTSASTSEWPRPPARHGW